jgi:hypothetical protein
MGNNNTNKREMRKDPSFVYTEKIINKKKSSGKNVEVGCGKFD